MRAATFRPKFNLLRVFVFNLLIILCHFLDIGSTPYAHASILGTISTAHSTFISASPRKRTERKGAKRRVQTSKIVIGSKQRIFYVPIHSDFGTIISSDHPCSEMVLANTKQFEANFAPGTNQRLLVKARHHRPGQRTNIDMVCGDVSVTLVVYQVKAAQKAKLAVELIKDPTISSIEKRIRAQLRKEADAEIQHRLTQAESSRGDIAYMLMADAFVKGVDLKRLALGARAGHVDALIYRHLSGIRGMLAFEVRNHGSKPIEIMNVQVISEQDPDQVKTLGYSLEEFRLLGRKGTDGAVVYANEKEISSLSLKLTLDNGNELIITDIP